MQVQVDRLRTALKLIAPVIDKKTKATATLSMLLENGKAVGTDQNNAIFLEMPEVTETYLIPVKQVTDLLEAVPGYTSLNIAADKKMLRLTWDDGGAGYPLGDPRDFPDMNRYDKPTLMGDIDGTP